MKRAIHNPNTVNHLLYICLIIIFCITLAISNVIPRSSDGGRTFLSEVLLNLSYGCIASTVVAWLIDCANTRSANRQANSNYDAVYAEIKSSLAWFLDSWARLCKVCFDDEDYANIYLTWHEWYKVAKEHYQNAEPEKQERLTQFIKDQLSLSSSHVINSITKIRSQSHLLTLNHIMDRNIHNILEDFHFEFTALEMHLSRENSALFGEHMDAITQDLIQYINDWNDIQHYNKHVFRPYYFFERKSDSSI